MNENLIKYAVIFCLVIGQILVVYLITDNGTKVIGTENALKTGIIFGIFYLIAWMKCPKIKQTKTN